MNWSRVKSIMIVFLIIVNFSLLSYVVFEEVQEGKRNAKMADTVSALLEKSEIFVSKDLIADSAKQDTAQSYYADNIISDYESFAKNILGDDLEKTNENQFSSNLGKIGFKGDYFKAEGKLCPQKISKLNIFKACDKYLNELGIDIKNSEKKLTEENEKFIVSYTKKVNDRPVFSTGLEIIADYEGIISISGNWYNINSKSNSITELKSISGALIEYKNKTNKTEKREIVGISLGLSALNLDTYHESLFLTPVWKISDKNGKVVYIDARENN